MPDELLAFYISEGIDKVCFNVEEIGGQLRLRPVRRRRRTPTCARAAGFLRRFWHRARASG